MSEFQNKLQDHVNEKISKSLSNEDDILGLDKTIKVKKSKVSKIDLERIFSQEKGFNCIIKNINRLKKTMTKKKIIDSSITKTRTKNINKTKFEIEFQNLNYILQFYQLWCHNLFPKANFRDCITLLQKFGVRSPQLKQYRKQLIENEIRKLKNKEEENESVINVMSNEDLNCETLNDNFYDDLLFLNPEVMEN